MNINEIKGLIEYIMGNTTINLIMIAILITELLQFEFNIH